MSAGELPGLCIIFAKTAVGFRGNKLRVGVPAMQSFYSSGLLDEKLFPGTEGDMVTHDWCMVTHDLCIIISQSTTK